MIDSTTKSFQSLFKNNGVAGIPCEEADIDALQQRLGVELPPAYKAFLLLVGQGCQALEGSHYAVGDNLADLQAAGRRIAAHERTDLPAEAFVFLVHQGFACQFFLLHDTDDPIVFECVEGSGPPRRVSARFSDWLLEQVARSRSLKQRRIPRA